MIKKLATKFLVSRIGSMATPVIATAVAASIARVAAFDPALAGRIDEAATVGFIVAALVSAANYFTNNTLTKDVKKIQAVVNVPVDGWFGPVTYTEVRKAIPVVK
jgi:ABC-type enterobactin transport system permease subunit